MRQDGNLSNIFYSFSCEWALRCLSSILTEIDIHSFSSNGLQIGFLQIFNIQMQIISWLCTLFGSNFWIISNVSLLENVVVDRWLQALRSRGTGESFASTPKFTVNVPLYIYIMYLFLWIIFFLLNNFTTINKIKNNTYGKNKMETTFSLKAKLWRTILI